MIGTLFGKFFLTSIGKMLPPWLWEIIVIALLAGGALLFHHTQVVHHDRGVRAEQKKVDDGAFAAALKKLNAQAVALRQKIETTGTTITNQVRTEHDKQDAASRALANALRVRGAGKADARLICNPDFSAAAGGPQRPGGPGDAAVAGLPDQERVGFIALPVAPTFDFAEQHDAFRNEAVTWRDWYAKEFAAWEKMRVQPK